jgi:phosphoenolpyruvate synthase/pyruvate phosphate dikinase
MNRAHASNSLRFGSRDDMGNFLNAYTENEVFKKTPFASLDQSGVGQLVEIAIKKGRATRPRFAQRLRICPSCSARLRRTRRRSG